MMQNANQDNLKIVCVSPSLNRRGMERVLATLSNYFCENGYEVKFLFLLKNTLGYNLDSRITLCMPKFDYNIKSSRLKKVIYHFRIILYLRSEILKFSPSLILCFGDRNNIELLVSTLFLKQNVFISDRSNPLIKKTFFLSLFKKIFYPYATGIIAQTNTALEKIKDEIKNKNITVIHNPVIKFLKTNDICENIVLNVGSLVSTKGHLELIHIFTNARFDDWKLWIIGEGPLRSVLLEEISKLNQTENIYILNSTEFLSAIYSKVKIFAFTSYSEGFPNALCEAMVFPLPCISYDCNTGPRDIIKNNVNGLLIPLGDTEMYTYKLKQLMTNEKLRARLMKQSALLSNFLSIEIIGQQYLSFMKNSIKNRQSN